MESISITWSRLQSRAVIQVWFGSVCCLAQVQAAGQLEQSQGLDVISLNALVAALANADRMVEAEEQLQRAVALARSQGAMLFQP